jgi:lysozyme
MIDKAGVDLIKSFEGCRLRAYLDTLASPPVWTIGWGHTGPSISAQTEWTQSKADGELERRLSELSRAVAARCTRFPNVNQMSAMVSFAYNVGIGNFSRSSVLRLHNAGQFAAAAAAFAMWNKAGGRVRAGLTRRRAAEAALYLTPATLLDIAEPQTTRGQPEARDPSGRPPVAAIAAGAGAMLTGAQQVIAQVASVWDGLSEVGISPHVLLAVLGTLAFGVVAWFAYDAYVRHQEGSR